MTAPPMLRWWRRHCELRAQWGACQNQLVLRLVAELLPLLHQALAGGVVVRPLIRGRGHPLLPAARVRTRGSGGNRTEGVVLVVMRPDSPIPSALAARGSIGVSARGRDAFIVACPDTSRGNVPSSGQRHRELRRYPLQPGCSLSRRLMQMPAHQLLQVKARL
ncbi:uncharacterized protein LOC133029305 [Cannabis sativa]|uniref:uncharacterized protein LOC133029305 n=1 Tax=Cannabis sativa TaxID=3483 RepID=UPI0029CA4392|nr:uncharacterized protein LOC133029305 [Cannabis sativa]